MRIKRKYRIIIQDEAHLHTIASKSLTPRQIWWGILALLLAIMSAGFLFVLLTPAKNLIPGYFHSSRRAESEEALMRVDSVADAYRRNEAYLANIRNVLNTDRTQTDSTGVGANVTEFSPDSLIGASAAEKRFVKGMQEREKFNISLIASLEAEGMLMYPVNSEGTVTQESKEKLICDLAVPPDAPLGAIADGTVLARYPGAGGNTWVLIIQHENGFVSRYSGLAETIAEQGERIRGGQILAFAPGQRSGQPAFIHLEMWHEGEPLVPAQYIEPQQTKLTYTK